MNSRARCRRLFPRALAILFLLAACAAPQSVRNTTSGRDGASAPRAVGQGWLFSFEAPRGTQSVHLAGEFNGWSPTAWPMSDADGDGVWTLAVPLETGRYYQYKFVRNGSEWITDPHAPAVDPNNYNNGILFTRRPGEAYLSDLIPADGARCAAIPAFSGRVHPEGRTLGTPSLVLSNYLGSSTWKIPVDHDAAGGSLTATLPADLPDGEYRLDITIPAGDGEPLAKTLNFSLDRSEGVVDAPPFYDGAVIYEIFVRSFRDGRGDDGIGDFAGLTASLDYLNDGDSTTTTDLGVDALWLMPVQPSPSYHGYDITDYEGIEEDYGNLEDYRRFVAEAHRRGLRVILDFVVNHTSDHHPFFRDAFRNPGSPFTSWYKFTNPGNTAYQGFAGIGAMPELNFRSVEMRRYLEKVAEFWIDIDQDGDLRDGVDGFRCDVAKGPPHNYWKELRRETKSLRPDFLLLAEVWDNEQTIAPYFHAEFDMAFDYPLYYSMLDLLSGKKSPDRFLRDCEALRGIYPAGAQLCRFLDNHDNNRIASILGEDPRRIRLATGLLFALPGTPLLYYGTETGTPGMKPDPDLRKPMDWEEVEAQTHDPASMLSWHRGLIRDRQRLPGLADRDDTARRTFFPGASDHEAVLVFERRSPVASRATLVVANLSASPVQARVTLTGAGAIVRGFIAASGEDTVPVDLTRGIDIRLEPWERRLVVITEN